MWKQGGRSSALDRAQALLYGKRSGRGGTESVPGSTAKTPGHTGAVKTGSAPPNPHTLFSDLSDLSSASSAPEHGADTGGSAAAAAVVVKTQGREGDSTTDLRPQSSLSGGGSRFLKKAPPTATNSSQSPVSKSQMQWVPEPSYVSSSQRSSQTAALSRLAQIESRIRSRKQAQEQAAKPAENQALDLGISQPTAAQSLEHFSAESSSDQSLKGKRFLKNKTAVAVNNSNIAAPKSPEGPGIGVRSRSRAAFAVVSSSGVSLESDEEDMKKLFGDSLDLMDNSYLIPRRPSTARTADKMLSRSSQKVLPTPSPPPAPPSPSSGSAPPCSNASPSRRGSPFRFTGQAQAHFSPSVLSPSPSPPCVSPSPSGRLDSPHRVGSPQRSLSSMSGWGEVLSLEELFPVRPGSEDPQSEMSSVFSEDFKINVMTLDDLVPADLGFTPEKEREAKHRPPLPGSPSSHQQLPRLKEKEQQQEEKEVLDYQSDFESESRTEPNRSATQVSEHLQGHGDEEEVVSEVREEASDPDVYRRTEDDYSSTFSDTSRSYTSWTSDGGQTLSRSRDSGSSRTSVSHDTRASSRQSRRRASTRKVLKEAAVQTQTDPLAYTWPAGMATVGPSVGMAYVHPNPVVAHTLSPEMVEALSTFNPALFALNEMLKQQFAMTRQFIESSRRLHSSLMQSLEPPNYRYTTLEDTKEYIRKHRPPKLTMEKALEEVLQEMRDHHV